MYDPGAAYLAFVATFGAVFAFMAAGWLWSTGATVTITIQAGVVAAAGAAGLLALGLYALTAAVP